jgi:hypothetical protein
MNLSAWLCAYLARVACLELRQVKPNDLCMNSFLAESTRRLGKEDIKEMTICQIDISYARCSVGPVYQPAPAE